MDIRIDESLTLEVSDRASIILPSGNGQERVTITLEAKSGRCARLRIQASDGVTIRRPQKKE